MSWKDERRRLTASSATLAILCLSLPCAAQLALQSGETGIRSSSPAATPRPVSAFAPQSAGAQSPTPIVPQAPPGAAPQQSPASAAQPAVPPIAPEELGDTLMARQRYQAAIEAYKKGPRDSAALWNKMGIAYQLMLNMDEAQRCYEKSLKLDPKNANVLNNMGTVYDSLKQYPSAERMYRRAVRYDPKSALIFKNLGTNLLTQHKYKKGWDDYKVALSLDPDIFQHSTSPRVENPASVGDRGAMNYYMAKGCVRAGMNDRAIEYLRMALNEGFTSAKKIMADSEFAGLRGIPAFEELLNEQKTP